MNCNLPAFTYATMQAVAYKLGLAHELWMQDWPIEVADGTRLEEFFNHYQNEKNPKYKLAIAQVLLVSLDAAFIEKSTPSDAILAKLAHIFKQHTELLDYWLCLDDESSQNSFAITPWLRSI